MINTINVGDSCIEFSEKNIEISSKKIVFEGVIAPPNTKTTWHQ